MTNSTSSISGALDREYAPAWRPAPGDKVIGEIVALSTRDGEFGSYAIVTLKTDEGAELAVHAFHQVLANELAKAKPSIGDQIGIKYVGRDPDKGYHRYSVGRDGASDEQFDWARFSEEPAVAPTGQPDIPADETGLTGGDDDLPF